MEDYDLMEEDVAEYVDVDYAALEADCPEHDGCAGCMGCLLPVIVAVLVLGIFLLLLLN